MNKKILKNPGWKIGALLLAFALWFHLTTGKQFSKELTVDIEYINIPAGFDLSADSQKSVQVEITTDGKRLFKLLYFEELKIQIDLLDFTRPGSYSIEFVDEQLQIPSGKTGIEIKYIAPLACDFELIKQN